MSDISVSDLIVYPIKSTAGISLSSVWLDQLGLSFDRRFVLTTPGGDFITARTHSQLCLVQANIVPHGLVLTAPNMPSLAIAYRDFLNSADEGNYQDIKLWSDTIASQHCQQAYDQWFSDYLATPCQLMYFGEHSHRPIKNSQQQTAFADAYPLLLISQASLDYLNSQLEQPVTMRQFRPNIVVTGCQPFAEDSWQRISIGGSEFELTGPCSRCVFTTVDPNTGHKHFDNQPFKTLKYFRQTFNGEVMFGQNLRQITTGNAGHENGQLKLGDQVSVLARKEPPVFLGRKQNVTDLPADKVATNAEQAKVEQVIDALADDASSHEVVLTATAKPKLNFSSWQQQVVGNNQQTLLEQAENAGVRLPYSCRGGMCGRCKVKLESGQVKQLATDGLSDREQRQHYVLACSCVPLTDIVISKP